MESDCATKSPAAARSPAVIPFVRNGRLFKRSEYEPKRSGIKAVAAGVSGYDPIEDSDSSVAVPSSISL